MGSMRSSRAAYRYAVNCLTIWCDSESGHPHAEQKKSQFSGFNSQTDFTRNSMLELPQCVEAVGGEAPYILVTWTGSLHRPGRRCVALSGANGCG